MIPAEKYDISADSFSQAAIQVVSDLQEAGFEAYLVGGCIRDALLGKRPKDFDVSTSASPEEVKRIFRNCRIIGRRFRIAHVRIGRELIEVSTFRANPHEKQNATRNELREGDEGQLIRDNVFGTCDEDAWRRDFSINALYYNPTDNVILDYMGSIGDIKNGVLKSIGDIETRFSEDPVRMLRIIRFAAKFGFKIPEDANALIHAKKQLISTVSAPRLFEEILKLFHGGQAVRSFELLREFGLFKLMFPFTDEYLIEGEFGMAERALTNTDKRIQEGKGVIPAFLFTCLLWDPVREDANLLMDQGNTASKAWRIAMMDALRDQSLYVSIPRRMADTVMEIWTLHFRLVGRKPQTILKLMEDRRFRAAYDFMLLRASLSEVDSDLADWWTDIQEVDESTKQQMIDDLLTSDDDEEGGEPNFNSVEYMPDSRHGFSDNNSNKRNSNGKNHRRGRNQGQGARNQSQGGRRQNNRSQSANGKPRSQQNGQKSGQPQRRRRPASANGQGQQSSQGQQQSQEQNQQRNHHRNQQNNQNQNQNQGNSSGGNSTENGNNKKRNSKTSRSNPYRSRRKNTQRQKKEDSYF